MLAAQAAGGGTRSIIMKSQSCSTPTPGTSGTSTQPCSSIASIDWTARGYSHPEVKPYAPGWSKGEHTHPVHILITVVAGRMGCIIADQRFVIEPGDELFYPAHVVHSARNLYDGTSQTMEISRQ